MKDFINMNYNLKPLLQGWNLSDIRLFDHIMMPNNFVVKAYSHDYNYDVVIKVGLKHVIDFEIIALNFFQSDNCVKLLKYDQNIVADATVLMLEYVQPGTSLKDLYLQGQEQQALDVFIRMIQRIYRSPLSDQEFQKYEHLQTVVQKLSYLDTFQSKYDGLKRLLPRAIAIKNQLVARQRELYFLHGDLHHENILQKNTDYVMIDPQGIIGELCYEMSAFLYNPVITLLEHDDLVSLMKHRFDRLEQEFAFNRQRIIEWVFVRSVLAACYYQEDNQDKDNVQNFFVVFAELIACNFL